MKTIDDLRRHARAAIERQDTLVCEVATEFDQILGNIAHLKWFEEAVMDRCYETLNL